MDALTRDGANFRKDWHSWQALVQFRPMPDHVAQCCLVVRALLAICGKKSAVRLLLTRRARPRWQSFSPEVKTSARSDNSVTDSARIERACVLARDADSCLCSVELIITRPSAPAALHKNNQKKEVKRGEGKSGMSYVYSRRQQAD